ncbi:MAG: SPOR domain-containing protein [Magnetococcales bacterium]|nr:SPOR domain-containing protein [Magnetococcales bacterium]
MSKIANLKMGMAGFSLSSIPGLSMIGQLFAKVGMPTALRPILTGVGPFVLVVVLAILNIVLFFSAGSPDDDGEIWDGPLMTEKLYQLPDPATAKIVNTGIKKKRRKNIETQQLVVEQPAKTTPEASAPSEDPYVEEEYEEEEEEEVTYPKKFIVQVGQFMSESGVDSLIKNMQNRGYYPKVSVIKQKSYLNNVQAGPYATVEAARESEVKLRANGKVVKVESSEDGYIISLSKSSKLSPALTSMQRYDAMGIAPLRLVKAAQFKPVKSVYMGPYNSRQKAEEVKTRMAGISMAIPVVHEWEEEDEEE